MSAHQTKSVHYLLEKKDPNLVTVYTESLEPSVCVMCTNIHFKRLLFTAGI